MSEVTLYYSSPANITFRGELETGIEREDWDAMSDEEKGEVYSDLVWELVNIYEKEE